MIKGSASNKLLREAAAKKSKGKSKGKLLPKNEEGSSLVGIFGSLKISVKQPFQTAFFIAEVDLWK